MKLTEFMPEEELKEKKKDKEEQSAKPPAGETPEPPENKEAFREKRKSSPVGGEIKNVKTLLDSDYVTDNDRAVIRLFYKENGKRTIELVTDFEPYFYAVPGDVSRLESGIKNLTKIKSN